MQVRWVLISVPLTHEAQATPGRQGLLESADTTDTREDVEKAFTVAAAAMMMVGPRGLQQKLLGR